ncbi:MAG TPA: hypothetical protein DCP51_08405, partial [Clostridiales bacterium]|nr:hypothetical protein [Clostridiales bacterium]
MKKIIAIILTCLLVIPMGIIFSSAEETNVAADKSYTLTGLHTVSGVTSYPDTGNKEMTDGKVSSVIADFGYSDTTHPLWTGLHWKGAGAISEGSTWTAETIAYNSIVVDLEEVMTGLTKFVTYSEDIHGIGISKFASVEVLVSDDNSTFTSVGTSTGVMSVSANVAGYATDGLYKYEITPSAAVSGRYVKFTVKHGNNWGFISEVEVYQNSETTSEESSEEPAEVEETITVDGTLDDNGWAADGWTHVDSSNGMWQTALAEGVTRADNYDFQFRTDDANLYFAFKFNGAPLGTAAGDCFGNGKGSNLRLWTFVDGSTYEGVAYTTYNSFLNIAYKDGEAVVTARLNTVPTANTSVELAIDGVTVETSEGDDFWYVEASIPFEWLNATTDSNFFVSYSTPLEIVDNAPVSNNALTYGAYADGPEGDKLANTPYKNWDENADIEITFEDVKLGLIINDDDDDDDDEDDFVDITGPMVENPSYLLEV